MSKRTRLGSSFYSKRHKGMAAANSSINIVDSFESPTSVPQETDVEVINLTCDNHVTSVKPKVDVIHMKSKARMKSKADPTTSTLPKKTLLPDPRTVSKKPLLATPGTLSTKTLLADPGALSHVSGGDVLKTRLLEAKVGLDRGRSTASERPSSRQPLLRYDFTLSSASSLPRSSEAYHSPTRKKPLIFRQPINSLPKAKTAGKATQAEQDSRPMSSPYFLPGPSTNSKNSTARRKMPMLSSGASRAQAAKQQLVDVDAEPVVISSPSPPPLSPSTTSSSNPSSSSFSTNRFDDRSLNLGLGCENSTFTNTRTKRTKSPAAALNQHSCPTLSTDDFFINSLSSEKRRRDSGSEVIFQGEERNGPKQYHLRGLDQPPRKLNSVPSEDRLQRPPLHSSEPHKPSYSQLLGMAKNNESRGKQALKGNEKMKSYSTMLGNIRPPVLRTNAAAGKDEGDVTMNLTRCQIGQLVMESDAMLELGKDWMKLKIEYGDIGATFEVQYKEIEDLKHCNAEMVSLRLRVGPVRRISNVLGVKLKLQEFFRYEKMDCPVSVITLCFKKRLPRLEAIISDLENKEFSSSGCEVKELTNEEMVLLLDNLTPLTPPERSVQGYTSYIEDNDSSGFYGNSTAAASRPVQRPVGGSDWKERYGQSYSEEEPATGATPTNGATPTTHRRPQFAVKGSGMPRKHGGRLLSLQSPKSSSNVKYSWRQSTRSHASPSSGDFEAPTLDHRPPVQELEPPDQPFAPPSDDFVPDSDLDSQEVRRSTRLSSRQKKRTQPDVKLLSYKPKGCKVSLELMAMDVETLNHSEYLNDKIINFYLRYMMFEMLEEELQTKLHIFSSFFYERLSNSAMDNKALSLSERIHNRVKTWTRHVDLFAKEYLVIPVNEKAHWYVVLVCRPGSFDPSKIKPSAPCKLTKKSRRRKPLKPKKRASRTSGERVTNPLLDTSGSGQGQSGVGTESDGEETNIDPLHVGVYDSADEENGKGDMDAECAIPGERLAVAMENTDEVQNKEDSEEEDVDPISIPDSPTTPTSHLSQLSPFDKQCLIDPGIGMWAGISNTASVGVATLEAWDGEVCATSEEVLSCTDSDVVDMEWEPEVKGGGGGVEENERGETREGEVEEYLERGEISPTERVETEGGEVEECLSSGEMEGTEEPVEDTEGGAVKEGEEKETEGGLAKIKEEEKEEEESSCLIVLDSLGVRRRDTTANRVRNYLTAEWKVRKQEATGKEMKFDHLPLKYPEIPLQENFFDCGIFVLQYVETVVKCLQESRPLPEDSAGWGGYSHFEDKREQIKALIKKKQEA